MSIQTKRARECPMCGQYIGMRKVAHFKKSHPELKFSLKRRKGGGHSDISCGICGACMNQYRNLVTHYFVCHLEALKDEDKQRYSKRFHKRGIKKVSGRFCRACGGNITGHLMSHVKNCHPEYKFTRDSFGQYLYCGYCSKKVTGFGALVGHIRESHKAQLSQSICALGGEPQQIRFVTKVVEKPVEKTVEEGTMRFRFESQEQLIDTTKQLEAMKKNLADVLLQGVIRCMADYEKLVQQLEAKVATGEGSIAMLRRENEKLREENKAIFDEWAKAQEQARGVAATTSKEFVEVFKG